MMRVITVFVLLMLLAINVYIMRSSDPVQSTQEVIYTESFEDGDIQEEQSSYPRDGEFSTSLEVERFMQSIDVVGNTTQSDVILIEK